MSRFEYTATCPECSKVNQTSHLGFDTDTSKIVCDGENPHEYDDMPGEPAPQIEDQKLPSTPEFETKQSGSEREWTQEEEAALDEQMKTAPRRDFGSMVADAGDEIGDSIAPAFGEHAEEYKAAVAEPTHVLIPVRGIGEEGPTVGLGGFVTLPGGDVLCGVRVSETWVSAMQAEGESQTPPKNVAEYLQEIIELGLIEWHVQVPRV